MPIDAAEEFMMVTAPSPPKDNPIRPEQSDTVPTDYPEIGPSQDPDAPPLDPEIDPDAADNRLSDDHARK